MCNWLRLKQANWAAYKIQLNAHLLCRQYTIAEEDATRKANKQIAAYGLTCVSVCRLCVCTSTQKYTCVCVCPLRVIQLFKQTTTATGQV